MTNRYMTPIKYTDGNGKKRTKQVHFELDPIELTDWIMSNTFDANELMASLSELRDIEEQDSRDLTPDEVRTMLGVVKLLAQISAGRPSDDGEYFHKDPQWVDSYAYKGFRLLLMTNPKEMREFMNTLLDQKVMDEFVAALDKANENIKAEEPASSGQPSPDELLKAWREKEEAKRAQLSVAPSVTE